MKERYDRHVVSNPLQVTDIVYVFQPMLQMKGTKKKLQKSFHGPYMVMEFRTPYAVILRRLSDGKIIQKSISVMRLKKGHLRQETNLWDPLPVNDSNSPMLEENDLPSDSFAEIDTPITNDTNPITRSDKQSNSLSPATVQTSPKPPKCSPKHDSPNTLNIFPRKRGRPRKSQTQNDKLNPQIIPPNTHPMKLRTTKRRTQQKYALEKAYLT